MVIILNTDNRDKYKKKIVTIPNMLSLLRLCLIPVMVWLYNCKQDYFGTLLVLLLSGATDIVDGIIARRFNMVSDFGKAFDPIADKLTQMAMLYCLVTRFPYMIILLILLVIKEALAAVMNLITIKKKGEVLGAVWHGKLTTVLLYSTVALHLVWFNIPKSVSNIFIALCTAMMLYSAVRYTIRHINFSSDKSKCKPKRQVK